MKKILDGAQSTALIAYKLSEIIPIYPITPSTPMSECVSEMSLLNEKNILNENVKIIEMQSETGVSGVLHGACISNALATTFTSSQGLLLMLPTLYKLAGENLPAVIHVSSRAIASHSLSIFCDHSDIMATRSSGAIIISSDSVQSSHDLALVAHLLALKSHLPVIHFIDGFRTSHEIQKIDIFEDRLLKKLSKDSIKDFKKRDLNKQFGTAQNPDTFFQNRIARESLYNNVGQNLLEIFERIKNESGKYYKPYQFYGNKKAEKIIVAMGSSCQTIEEYIDNNKEEKIGLIKILLYRPFINEYFLKELPKTTKIVTVLDRTKESGAKQPLALDVINALSKTKIKVLSGVYGLGGKEFSPSCVKAVYLNMAKSKKDDFTIGINDDKTFSSLEMDTNFECDNSFSIKIYGLGSDGSVSASKSLINILGKKLKKEVQGYFEYDSKKSGSLTQSHIRISDTKIKSAYLLKNANIICINNFSFIHRYNCLQGIKKNGIVLINSIFGQNELDKVLPKTFVSQLKEKNCKLYSINAQKIATECGLNNKINIIMQTALLCIINFIEQSIIKEEVVNQIKIMFNKKGKTIVDKNIRAMHDTFNNIEEIDFSNFSGKNYNIIKKNNKFYDNIMSKLEKLEGDSLSVSMFESDGSVPLDTSKYEKRGIALNLPSFIKENCIQCGTCTLTCPHSALQSLLIDEKEINLKDRKDFIKAIGFKDKLFRILLSPEDCTGCGICVNSCPALKKALELIPAENSISKLKTIYQKYRNVKTFKQNTFSTDFAKGLQFNTSLFKYPGACAGCGETSYIKILTMINGSNMMIANATGCSSIYSGSYGSCPFAVDESGKGITWANSLFEDNAEFGLGMELAKNYNNQRKNVWIIGGDGWAYDIGFGGLDHVLASGENVNILVLDNQSYSNTGGQMSKATPTGASVKFGENGKETNKKNLALYALTYKNVFVAQVAIGKDINQTIQALKQAQQYNGPSLIIAYCPCVNQGFDLAKSLEEEKNAVDCGFWPLFTYNPSEKRLILQSKMQSNKYKDFLKNERRFTITIEKGKQHLLDKQKNQSIEEYKILQNKSET